MREPKLTHIESLYFRPSTSNCLTLKSTPIVADVSSSYTVCVEALVDFLSRSGEAVLTARKSSSVKRKSKDDLPRVAR
jgi:hypothetical protein